MEKGSEISRAVIKSHNVMVLISEAVAPVAALIDVAQLVLPPRSGGSGPGAVLLDLLQRGCVECGVGMLGTVSVEGEQVVDGLGGVKSVVWH